MADVKWIKLSTDMFEDEKIDFITSLPESDAILVIWIRLLALAGKCNAGGYIHLTATIPYTEEMLVHKFRKSPAIIKLALETFKRLGMVDLDEAGIFLPNWDKHQNVEGLEKIKKQTAERVAKHRAKKKLPDGNALPTQDVTLHVTHGNATDIELDKDLDINNNITAREEIELNVNESEENVFETPKTANESSEIVSETKQVRSMDIGTRAINWAEINWGRMIPKGESDSILAWCDEFSSRGSPDPDGVVIEGLRRCLDADVRNMFYLRRVLTDWREAGVLTVAQVEARETERKSQKDNKRNKDPGDKSPGQRSSSSKYEKFYL
ncbi:phage replisome organizer N-terminal domain-containing protein [Desulfosporosinus sp. OT]|uniref:phage replisome organizer N-terminal domain-containing protein n=1 Tax=Desulfosporosinus sp. OT TaxID=913865 RepID=UPI0002239F7D|nr:phage replisome organizer N-terminal domain-containing protein [Desulfosporosinus sp. OT]EGW40676.1 dnaD and phage-associated domain protein [Desulfosporosinus sp. OT]